MKLFLNLRTLLVLVPALAFCLLIPTAWAVPTISVSPTCGSAIPGFDGLSTPNFVIVVTGNGFTPLSTVGLKFVNSDGEPKLISAFDTDSTGGFNGRVRIFADDLPEDNYKLYGADDSNKDNVFDIGAIQVYANLTIPCPSGS